MLRTFSGLCWAAALFATTGCGGRDLDELGLIKVTGKVTLDDQPLANARVIFEGDDKRSAQGVTDSEGRYVLMYDGTTAGATSGHKIVRIALAEVRGETDPDTPATGEGAVSEPLPARYNRKSELTADVASDRQTFDFALKSTPK